MIRERCDTIVGTANYLSPEVIKQHEDVYQGQTMAIDVWALGLIFYKMLLGRVAFPGTDQYVLFQNISNRKINWPTEEEETASLVGPQARDLIEKMLQINPNDRITIKEIKQHPYFAGFDFEKVSSENFCEAKQLVTDKLEEIKKEKQQAFDQ